VRQVAAALGLDVVIVAPGGLGVSFDVLATNYSMLKEHGVKLKGVVLNKVNPAKREMNVNYYRKALERWGVPLMGVIPEEASLPLLSMKAFHKILPQEPPPPPPVLTGHVLSLSPY
jgi:phosphate acetyltransferase